jgi:hypothetical protein
MLRQRSIGQDIWDALPDSTFRPTFRQILSGQRLLGSFTVRTKNGKQGQFGSTSRPRKITANRLQGSSRENWQKLRTGPLELINGRENAKAIM